MRGMSRLMIVNRAQQSITHTQFPDLINYLKAGDCLVLNDTRVIPARLRGKKITGGKVEVLLVTSIDPSRWECLVKASSAPVTGSIVTFDHGVAATVEGRREEYFVLSFNNPDRLPELGQIPLPPYIDREPEQQDAQTYQTVYAQHDGSVAAPTAGLHFTQESLSDLRTSGVEIVFITLHVGPGTFQPVRSECIEDHRMHAEAFNVSVEAATAINQAFSLGRRIVTVGTTSTRVLEHLIVNYGKIIPGKGYTDLFIKPGYSFGIVQALLTNFHLPCSTLIMLTCAFGGHAFIMKAYQEAVQERYRFFSYGDAMLII